MKHLTISPIKAVAIATIVLGTAGASYLAIFQPRWLDEVDGRLRSIITPNPPLGNITPARDLTGVWVSSLPGKGLQLYGQFEMPGSVTTLYEDGDMELQIDSVDGNIAYGAIRYNKMCSWGMSTVTLGKEKKTFNVPKTCFPDTGFMPLEMRVSGSAIDFGRVVTNDVSTNMQGTFTTDMISGSMTIDYPAYGELKGVFKLSRKSDTSQ